MCITIYTVKPILVLAADLEFLKTEVQLKFTPNSPDQE